MDQRLERILPRVQKPARYTGGEYRQIIKDKAEVDLRLAFCFPDIYEIGMSNIGMRILYATMNQMPGVWCERVFAPWGDMEQEMRKAGIPLYALESGDPVSDFDVVAFSLGYEMAYPAVLNMLDLAGIPLRSADRIKQMLQYIQDHYAEDVSVDQIAASASISASECLRCFHDMIGTTPNQYLRDRRAQRAAELLCGTGLSVTEIAGQCGFQDGSYFARSFRQVCGCGPTAYRRKARRAAGG